LTVLTIIEHPSPLLRVPSIGVVAFNGALRRLLDNMVETMHEKLGVGLSAVQVGSPIAALVMHTNGGDVLHVVNPVLTIAPDVKRVTVHEGCLSCPGEDRAVERAWEVTCAFRDGYGANLIRTFTGFEAIVLQHEHDHLAGRLIVD